MGHYTSAQATRLTAETAAGGRSLIRVTDDGLGMSRDDALLCLERHATSKIRKAEDLAAVRTMGFRGEALPSIASVSRMSITTRERDSQAPAATQVVIHGGKILEVRDAGAPAGTCIEVRNLFYNLPARRKFMRTEETESAHVQHYLTLAALAYPEVAFMFLRDGRTIWQLPAVKTAPTAEARLAGLKERLRALFGGEEEFVAVDFSAEMAELPERPDPEETFDSAESSANVPPSSSPFRLWGYLGAPGVSRATRQDQHIFVNRRPVENRALNFALMEGYHTSLMKGRYPVCCLFLEINPASVDVNIHPAKREVKFHNERDVRRLVGQAVRETLLKYHAKSSGGTAASQSQVETELPTITPAEPEPQETTAAELPLAGRFTAPFQLEPRPEPVRPPTSAVSSSPAPVPQHAAPPANILPPAPSEVPLPRALVPTPLLNVPLRLVGVVGRLYVVLESDRGLVLLDQHAAHERILFEQMLQRMEQGNVPAQRLLLPETMELSARDAQFVRELLPTLTRLGIGLNEFGERTFLLDALPPTVQASNPRRFVLDVIDELKASGESVNSMRLGEHTVAKTVCRHAVKAHDPLSGPELENLIHDLRQCAMPYTCPHGRPTMIEMNYRELEKKFGRLAP